MEVPTSNISTHYYKLAHINTIAYTVFSCTDKNDQSLLELELEIRNQNPRVFITYYNKYLYYYTLGENDQLNLSKTYPQLVVTYSNSVSVETFTNPQKSTNSDDFLAIASMGFLKAIKKVLLYTLSIQGVVQMFGNYCISSVNEVYNIIYLDSILFPGGDLLVSMIKFNDISLLKTSEVSLDLLDYNYVIYLIPSGIRCHFYDNENISKNFSKKKSSSNNLIELLKTSIGIDYSDRDIMWVKLIPNLKHLNNQTSKISKFIHTVENRKFILWPWDLCVLQSGEMEKFTPDLVNENSHSINTLDLISSFLDFNITNNQQNGMDNQNSLAPLSNSSIMSTGISSIGHTNPDIPKDINSVEKNDLPSVQQDIYSHTTDNVDMVNDNSKDSEIKTEYDTTKNEQENDIDDLFGEGSDSMDEIEDIETTIKAEIDSSSYQRTSNHDAPGNIGSDTQPVNSNQSPTSKGEHSGEQLTKESPGKSQESASSYIDIPKDQMTLQSVSPRYHDPGAPLPIIPTPIIPPLVQSVPHSNVASNSSVASDENGRSVFSPLLFNPIIKSNIDTKYGKGGKFYVDKEPSAAPDIEKMRHIRATSVSGYEKTHKESSFNKNINSSDSSEESDEDDDEIEDDIEVDSDNMEEVIANSPPLKLNTFNDSLITQSSGLGSSNFPNDKSSALIPLNGSLITGSPSANAFPKSIDTMSNSPFLANVGNGMSPIEVDSNQNGNDNPQTDKEMNTTKGESSNYLPLILRNVSVSTIPAYFLLNNLIYNEALPTFSINDDENDNGNDLDLNKDCELITKLGDIDEFLEILIPNLIFDLGLNQFNLSGMSLKKKYSSFVGFQNVDVEFENEFFKIFPSSYKVGLQEFLFDSKILEGDDEIVDQLNFLSDITNDEEVLDPKVKYQKLNSIEWNGISLEDKDKEASEKYKSLLSSINSLYTPTEDSCFKTSDVKARVMKNKDILNLNSIGIRFWKYSNFSPLNERKNFQILLIGENWGHNSDFLDKLIHNYRESNFGEISKIDLNTTENRPDLESINNGLLVFDHEASKSYNVVYKEVCKKLSCLVELIKLDLINKTNKFEFDRPVLLLFVNFDEKLNSFLQISSIFKHFKRSLHKHQVPLVRIFTKIIPSKFVVKKLNSDIQPKYLSNYKLTRLSMNLYNQCPNNSLDNALTQNLFTQLVKEPPTKINFKFLNSASKDSSYNSFNDDIFLHLAYERSVDRYWLSSAWSDTLGNVTYTKSWYCSSSQTSGQSQKHDLSSICDEVWKISTNLFKKLDDDAISKSPALGGRKFLVLTRINSIIPDDELIHWKRLSMKQKDISLIVLSVNSKPKLVFENLAWQAPNDSKSNEQVQATETSHFPVKIEHTSGDSFFKSFNDDFSPMNPSGAMVNSPSSNMMLQSPHQFLNATSSFSPNDMMLSVSGSTQSMSQNVPNTWENDYVVSHPAGEILVIIPNSPLPSFNAPTRLGMKMGYLVKELNNDFLAFEVSVLSCSNHWNLDQLMRLLLSHYKNMIVLNDILGVRDIEGGIKSEKEEQKDRDMDYNVQSLVPWHIAAVTKSLDYLVHVYVTE